MKKNLKEFIKNIIPVLLGVLIALWIDNWNEARKDQDYIDNFYSSLMQEFRDTDKEISEKTPGQLALVDTLDVYLDNETIPLMNLISMGGGLSGPDIKLNYWKAISGSKIELLDYEKLSILSDIDDGKQFLNYKREKMMDFVYANLTATGAQEKMLLKFIIMDYLNTQTKVQTDIQKILNEE